MSVSLVPTRETQQSQVVTAKQTRAWEIGKEAALASLPFLTLYKPFSFPIALGTGALRVGVSAFQLASAFREGDSRQITYEFIRTTVAVISLAGTLFAHPLGLLISTAHDLMLEVRELVQHFHDGKYKEALQSCLKILGHALYLGAFLYGGPELVIAFFAVQVVIAFVEAHKEFAQGRYIAAIGHALMSMVQGNRLVGQVKLFQLQREIQQLLNNPDYVGKLAEKWQFPSDHLPVGAKVGNARVISWNILNGAFMDWVTEKDSQGLNGSLITQLHAKPSQKYPGLTLRDELILSLLLQKMNDPTQNSHLILALQECSPAFVRALMQTMPSHMGIVLSDPTLTGKDHNIVVYNKETFTYFENQSAIVKAFPNSDPKRTLMGLMFKENATGEMFRIINAHLPGDPANPGTYDFANYLLAHLRTDCTTIALGDMNFTETEMQMAFNKAPGKSPFVNLVHYHTNVGAYTLDGKGTDHIWVNTRLPSEGLAPNDVLPDLQSTVDLLHPQNKTYWQMLEDQELEWLKKWFHSQEIKQQFAN